jgi:hypothetical protein
MMKYNKPEVLVLASAVDAVQSNVKNSTSTSDVQTPFTGQHGTLIAYEADE